MWCAHRRVGGWPAVRAGVTGSASGCCGFCGGRSRRETRTDGLHELVSGDGDAPARRPAGLRAPVREGRTMILKQFYLNCLAHASYLIGDEQTHTAAVVDPQRDVDQYLAFAAEHGLRIAHVFLTHFHADFVAGHLELRDRAGAAIYLGAAAKAEYAFTPLRDGDVVDLGRVRLQALETPGHTAESISLVVYDARSQRHRAAGRADRRHAVRRRRRASRSARGARVVGQRSRRPALRLAPRQAAGAARCRRRLSGARRRVAVRQGA